MPTGPLNKLAGRGNNRIAKSYDIIRYWHPESGKGTELVKQVRTLAEAQAHCSDPSTHCITGPVKNQFFDGYAVSSSKTSRITLW